MDLEEAAVSSLSQEPSFRQSRRKRAPNLARATLHIIARRRAQRLDSASVPSP